MQTLNINRKLAVIAVATSVLLGLTTIAMGENDAVRAIYLSAANLPTNLANIHTYAEPLLHPPKACNSV